MPSEVVALAAPAGRGGDRQPACATPSWHFLRNLAHVLGMLGHTDDARALREELVGLLRRLVDEQKDDVEVRAVAR